MLLSDSVTGMQSAPSATLAAVDRVYFVLWSERRCEACSWCVNVHLAVRRDPESTDDLAGLEALLLCMTVIV